MRIFLIIFLMWAFISGCDDEPPPAISPGIPGAAPPPAAGNPVPPPAKGSLAAKGETKKVVKKSGPGLTELDFVESPNNRDPFRPVISRPKNVAKPMLRRQYQVILSRYALDELKLIAVVTGGSVQPRAMFKDPTGLGVRVVRGQRISKSAAKVKRILSDKVILEIEEQSEEQSKFVDRVILLHEGGDSGAHRPKIGTSAGNSLTKKMVDSKRNIDRR